jgi:hypothetical protein
MFREDTKSVVTWARKNVKTPHPMAELVSYSKLLWGERAWRNETAECIRREERRKLVIWMSTHKNCGKQFIFVVSTQF